MHTIKRGGVYYYRRRIPLDLVAAHGGQREVYHSLHTKSRPEAERMARRASVALDDRWHGMRGHTAPHAAPPVPTPSPAPRTAPAAPTTPAGPTLEDMLPHWRRERRPNTKTADAYARAVQEFNALHESPALLTITRRMVIAYRDQLQEQGKAVGTINDRLSFIRALLGVAKGRGLLKSNPAEDAALPADKRAVEARMPYSSEQAEAVMAGTAGLLDTEPAKYWLPRLARWTGARLNELHQLRRQDVTERDGIRGISITDQGECMPGLPMRLKNAGSRRWVPLHPALAEFWTWAEGRPDGALFPDKPNMHGIISDRLSKWYGRSLRGPWRIADARVTFHSWRHTFADMCRSAGVAPEIRMALMGHTEGGTAGAYGAGQMPAAVLTEAIERLR